MNSFKYVTAASPASAVSWPAANGRYLAAASTCSAR